MANFELQLKTIEIMGWLMAAETAEEQSVKIGNFLTGMGFEYNRFGSMLIVAPVGHAAGKQDVCIRSYYHPEAGCSGKPVLQDGTMKGPYIHETLEMAVRLAVFTLLRNIITVDNVFMCVSDEQCDIPSVYSFDRILESYVNEELPERQRVFGVNVNVSGCSGSVSIAGINDYIDKTLLSVMAEECRE